jgi:hypothetical protein
MATAAIVRPEPVRVLPARENRFFATLAIVMALVVVAAFSTQLAMGRSTFGSPLRVHVHAIAFMGWVALFVAQSNFASHGAMALHRPLGWFSLAWIALMTGAASWVIVMMARNGTVPFFFTPQQFLITDPLVLVVFIGLTAWAITMRRKTEWHARLHICAMAALMGPAFGRLLPMPLMIPYAFEAAALAGVMFPIAGMIHDLRRRGKVHPAWAYGTAILVASVPLGDAIAYSPIGSSLYAAVTAGSRGASVDPLAYAMPPIGPVTGR